MPCPCGAKPATEFLFHLFTLTSTGSPTLRAAITKHGLNKNPRDYGANRRCSHDQPGLCRDATARLLHRRGIRIQHRVARARLVVDDCERILTSVADIAFELR